MTGRGVNAESVKVGNGYCTDPDRGFRQCSNQKWQYNQNGSVIFLPANSKTDYIGTYAMPVLITSSEYGSKTEIESHVFMLQEYIRNKCRFSNRIMRGEISGAKKNIKKWWWFIFVWIQNSEIFSLKTFIFWRGEQSLKPLECPVWSVGKRKSIGGGNRAGQRPLRQLPADKKTALVRLCGRWYMTLFVCKRRGGGVICVYMGLGHNYVFRCRWTRVLAH